MTSKHTPGPWDVTDEFSDYKFSVVRRGNGMKDLQVESESDARLIAAAPDQHEALLDTQVLLERLGLQSSDEYQRNAAAIAKATQGAA